MHILLYEIRKLINWKMLFVLGLVNVILYYFLISFDIEYFPNGRPELDSYRIGSEMVEKYGPVMGKEELVDFKLTYEEEIRKADELLQAREDAQQVGIVTYEEFRNIDINNKEQDQFFSKIIFEEEIDLFWELQERKRLLEYHQNQEMILDNEIHRTLSGNGKKHLTRLKETGQYDLYPEVSLMNFKDIINNIAIVVLISTVLMISPIFLSDRTSSVIDLQYTSKTGRSLFKKKVAAGLIAAGIVMTALLTIYLSLYSLNNPAIFFDVPLNSFIGESFWYNLTFFQYMILSIIAIYMIGFLLTLVAMAISTKVPNFISLIGVQVPIIVMLFGSGLQTLLRSIISMSYPIWLVPAAYMALAAILTVFLLTIWKREQTLDIT